MCAERRTERRGGAQRPDSYAALTLYSLHSGSATSFLHESTQLIGMWTNILSAAQTDGGNRALQRAVWLPSICSAQPVERRRYGARAGNGRRSDAARASADATECRDAPEKMDTRTDNRPLGAGRANRAILPRSFHLPAAVTDGSLTENLNKTGVRLRTDCSTIRNWKPGTENWKPAHRHPRPGGGATTP